MTESVPAIGLASGEQSALDLFLRRNSVAGAAVLEVGGLAPAEVVRAAGVASWTSIDPANTPAVGERYRAVRGPCSRVPAPDESFDFIFSANAFEHILDLPTSLNELRRVLRPGGRLHAHFGPIWSAPDGHHVEADVGGVRYRFWETPIIPPWYHLVLDEGELCRLMAHRLPADHAEAITAYCYRSPELNRLWYEDYQAAFAGSGLAVREQVAVEEIDYPLDCPPFGRELLGRLVGRDIDAEVAALLRDRPTLRCRDIFVVLQRE